MKVLLAAIVTVTALTFPALATASEPPPATGTVVQQAQILPSAELIDWALRWRRVAVRRLARYNRARACFGMTRARLKPVRPPLRASRQTWLEAGRAWRTAARSYPERTARLRYRMIHPGGSGWNRWRPLVRWHWPARLVDRAVQIIHYESGGNPRVRNGSSGAAGLFQLLPAPEGWANPDTNVWYAYHRKYVPAGGWSPWYGCAAF